MMIDRTKHLLVLALAASLVVAGCGDEGAVDNDEEIPAEDRMPPLHEDDDVIGDGPKNDELPAVAKGDETFPEVFDDLLDYQSPVSNQGSRGVCSIFSTVGYMESLYRTSDETPDDVQFSEQYLQWSAKNEPPSRFQNSSGSTASVNLSSIHRTGIPEEQYWPYETQPWSSADDEACEGDDQPTRCYTNGEPPEEAVEAAEWRLPDNSFISTRVEDIKAHMMNERHGVIVGGDFFYQAWNHGGSDLPTNDDYWSQGIVQYPNETDKDKSLEDRAGHSFLLVGWDDTLEIERMDEDGEVMTDEDGEPVTEQGFFIFKNSWGTGSFGKDNPHGDGYGFISYDHVQNHLRGRVVRDLPGPEHVADDFEELDCDDGQLECNNECVPVDVDNCGECGNTCASGQTCEAGQCEEVDQAQERAYGWDGESMPIPDCVDDDGDGDCEPGVATADIEVDNSGTIQDLETDVYIEHSYNGDIRIELTAPSGDTVTLREADGSWGNDIEETWRVDEFDGQDAEGTWELTVSDHAVFDEGTLEDWTLVIIH